MKRSIIGRNKAHFHFQQFKYIIIVNIRMNQVCAAFVGTNTN